ncbi:MAG: alpha/beta fold hydrolase [Alphaproteobacteria bacterium]|nr:alpha/beta fold hydrolase [Alphaproteobacteria bacterium]
MPTDVIGTSRVIVSALAPGYRLILIDMRGHGASDKPHEAHAYALDRCVGDVVAVMDALARQGLGVGHIKAKTRPPSCHCHTWMTPIWCW